MGQPSDPIWFVTGCSSGFGRELAQLLASRGARAVVTARSPEALHGLAAGADGRILTLALDVARQDQIDAAVTAALDAFGRIDVLVNNAGYGYRSTIEDGKDAEIRSMFETNVFGLFALTRAVLPGMRQQRRGHVINISSIAGLNGSAGTGYYAATKFAVEGFSDALRHEVGPLGIKVTCVEPGPFRTDFAGRSIRRTPVAHPADYRIVVERFRGMDQSSGRQAGDPAKAAQAILEVALSDNAPRHLLLGAVAYETALAKVARMRKDFDNWRELTLAADFPAAG
jgi:NAD(P)-dependent dehydrogenase (short-subunit alcohol dehydrogenase family)